MNILSLDFEFGHLYGGKNKRNIDEMIPTELGISIMNKDKEIIKTTHTKFKRSFPMFFIKTERSSTGKRKGEKTWVEDTSLNKLPFHFYHKIPKDEIKTLLKSKYKIFNQISSTLLNLIKEYNIKEIIVFGGSLDLKILELSLSKHKLIKNNYFESLSIFNRYEQHVDKHFIKSNIKIQKTYNNSSIIDEHIVEITDVQDYYSNNRKISLDKLIIDNPFESIIESSSIHFKDTSGPLLKVSHTNLNMVSHDALFDSILNHIYYQKSY